MRFIRNLVPVPLSGDGDDCQVTIDNPSGDPDAQSRAEQMARQICGNLTTDHPSANYDWHRH